MRSYLGSVLRTFFALAIFWFLSASPARAELRAFRLKIVDSENQAERFVVTRLDHVQYPMYNHLRQTEVVSIDQTWMCYLRSDYTGALCAPPAEGPAN